MLTAWPTDEMMDLHPAPHVSLGPPANGTAAELGGEFLHQESV
jgi:hypothetical protein